LLSDICKGAFSKLNINKTPKEVTDEEWKKVLTPEQYEITRESGTEKPFSGKYDKFFENGIYHCVCCGAQLFKSDAKYNSGCGWPAFSKSVDNDLNITRIKDFSNGMERTEVRCKQCNAHLGHVFGDGPKETGERYCINSGSIDFAKES
uniref:Peptide-methionine (R)-S-oxide reductase n=1 Tax=Enterobius vermicularis TaxID=51028 RepID=A0A0N4V5G3_ENTVE